MILSICASDLSCGAAKRSYAIFAVTCKPNCARNMIMNANLDIPRYVNLLPITHWHDVSVTRRLIMQAKWLTGSPIHYISEYYAHDHNLLLRTGHVMTAPQIWLCAPGFALSLTSTISKVDWTVDVDHRPHPYQILRKVIWNQEQLTEPCRGEWIPQDLGHWLHVYDITATYKGDYSALQQFFMYIHMAGQLPPV